MHIRKSKSNSSKFRILSSGKLPICISIIHPDRTIETDIYYKDTNAHDYLPYDSAHSDHSRDNVSYNLAKRRIVLVSNKEKAEYKVNVG